eukprot:m.241838 g.241838  ORF g.241838 m.241838 type:complete len:1382 (-) comp13928_c0_seq1:86-4231(-)
MDVSGQALPSQSYPLAEGRFMKKGMEAFHNWTARKFAISATDKGGRLTYFQDDNPMLGRPSEWSGKKKEVELLGAQAAVIPEGEANPSGPLLGIGGQHWEMGTGLHEGDVRALRGSCPLAQNFNLFFICRTRGETAALVELCKCSDIKDPQVAALSALSSFLRLAEPPGLIGAVGFEMTGIMGNMRFLLTSETHGGRPVYRAQTAGGLGLLAYWSPTAARWFIATNYLSDKHEKKGKAIAVIVEDVPRLEFACSPPYVRHVCSPAMMLTSLTSSTAQLPPAGLTYIMDPKGELKFHYNIRVHMGNILAIMTRAVITRSVAEAFVAIEDALPRLFRLFHVWPRREPVVNGLCNLFHTLSRHQDGSSPASATVRDAVIRNCVIPMLELIAQLFTGKTPSEQDVPVYIIDRREFEDQDTWENDALFQDARDPEAKPKDRGKNADSLVTGLYLFHSNYNGRSAFYQPYKRRIVNQSDKTFEEHLRSPYYLFWDPTDARWVISAQLGNIAEFVAFARDDVMHPGAIGTYWIRPHEQNELGTSSRGTPTSLILTTAISAKIFTRNDIVSLTQYTGALCDIVKAFCYSSAASMPVLTSAALPVIIDRIGVLLTSKYRDIFAERQAYRRVTDFALGMLNSCLVHLEHRASMRTALLTPSEPTAQIADKLVSAFMSASSRPVLSGERPRSPEDIAVRFQLVALLELAIRWDEEEVILPIDLEHSYNRERLQAIVSLLDAPILLRNEPGPVADALRVRFYKEVTPRLLDLALQATLRGKDWINDSVNLTKLVEQIALICESLPSAHALASRPKALARLISVLTRNTSTQMDRMLSESKITENELRGWHENSCHALLKLWATLCGHVRIDADIKNAKAELDGSENASILQKELESALFTADPVPTLVHTLEVRSSMEYQVLAAQCLMRLAESHEEHREAIARCKGIEALLQIIKTGSIKAQARAAYALSSLLRNSNERVKIFVAAKGIQPVLRLIASIEDNSLLTALEMVVMQVADLAESAQALIMAGGLPPLVNLLKKPGLPADHVARLITIFLRLAYVQGVRDTLQQSGVTDIVAGLLASADAAADIAVEELSIVERPDDDISFGQPLTDDYDDATELLQSTLDRKKSNEDRAEARLLDRPLFRSWSLRQQGSQLLAFLRTPPVEAAKAGSKHIMLSYNWTYQSTFLRVRDALQAKGYTVWMDVDKMKGNLLDRMSEAVENAYIVLMCFAPEYERSDNCRLEAEYCVQRKVPFIPVILAPGFSPNGWLGILKGQKLYYDLSNPAAFAMTLPSIVQEIDRIKANPRAAAASVPTTPAVTSPPPATPTSAPAGDDRLRAFLVQAGAEDALDALVRNRVDLALLSELSAQDLFTMGIAFGSAKRISNAIAGAK